MQRTPAFLFLGRDLHTHMDLLKPNCEEYVTMHQDAQTRHHNQHAKPCIFELISQIWPEIWALDPSGCEEW